MTPQTCLTSSGALVLQQCSLGVWVECVLGLGSYSLANTILTPPNAVRQPGLRFWPRLV